MIGSCQIINNVRGAGYRHGEQRIGLIQKGRADFLALPFCETVLSALIIFFNGMVNLIFVNTCLNTFGLIQNIADGSIMI